MSSSTPTPGNPQFSNDDLAFLGMTEAGPTAYADVPEIGAMSAAEYIRTVFDSGDLICVMMLRKGEKPKHIFATVEKATSTKFMDFLRKQNDAGCDIYICMNPLTAKRRVKENVECIRTAYIEIDQNGAAALQKISQSMLAPKPHAILQSSPGKFHVVWKVKGIQPADQERLLDALIQEFGGDPAASDCTRVLRLPGFKNHKYPEKPVVEVIESNFNGKAYTATDFKVKVASTRQAVAPPIPAVIPDGQRNDTLASLAGSMRRRGASEAAILAALRETNRQCQTPLPDSELQTIAKSIARYQPAKPEPQIEINSLEEKVLAVKERPDMSRGVLCGRLGEICEKNMLGDFPVAYAWPSLVTAASVLVPEGTRPGGDHLHNLYTALVGPVDIGKSQAIEWGMKLLRVPDDPQRYSEVKAGSAERLLKHMNRLRESNQLGPRVLMFLDEWKFFFDKAGIENSVFPTLLTTGFYRRNTTILDTHGHPLSVATAFSWIGGIVDDAYEDCFSRAASLGLHDRFLHGVNPSSYAGFNYRPFEGEVLPEGFTPRSVEIDRTVWECLKAWRIANPHATREAEIAFRVAEICASFDGAQTLYGEDLAPHLILAADQMKIRETLKPNIGETPDAACAIKVENYLKAHGPAGEWLDLRVMMKAIHYERFGPTIFERTLRGLDNLKVIQLGKRDSAAGKGPGGRRAEVIRLVLE